MSYIYDIYLNFKEIPYEFYDWNRNDLLIHIKRIPIFRINVDNYLKMLESNIMINEKFIKYVHNKTEVWNKFNEKLSCALITDLNNVFAVMFDENGKSIKRSFLMIDEELEILDDIDNLNEINIEFKVLNKIKYKTKTRKQIKYEEFIEKELKNINEDRLKYIYYDCFGDFEDNKDNIIKRIKSIKKTSSTYENLYNILKLTSTSKNKMI